MEEEIEEIIEKVKTSSYNELDLKIMLAIIEKFKSWLANYWAEE